MIDLIITQPAHVDFPLFRYNLERFHYHFKHIIIAFANLNQPENYLDFFRDHIKGAVFLNPPENFPDWRQNAMYDAVKYASDSKYILFMEQDFLIKDESFWDKVMHAMDFAEVCIFKEDQRVHPAFCLATRYAVEHTSLDFSANPPAYDHFGKFFSELVSSFGWVELQGLGLHNKEDFYHLNGLTQNYACFKEGQQFYKAAEFLAYNNLTIERNSILDIPIRFLELSLQIRDKYGVGNASFLDKFFPEVMTK